MGLHLAPTADQDNHREDWGSVVDTRTGVVTTSLTRPDLLAAMRARHVYATQDRNLRLIVTYNGELMGTRFQGAQVPAGGRPLRNAELTDGGVLLDRPVASGAVVDSLGLGGHVFVLGSFGGFLYVQSPHGRAGWVVLV